jgi:hypothetical protein
MGSRAWRRLTRTAVTVVAAVLVATPVVPAAAAPDDPSSIDHSGANPTLKDVLESTSKAYLDAQAVLEGSKKRQREMTTQLRQAEAELPGLTEEVNGIAAAAYRMSRNGTASALLEARSPDTLLTSAAMLELLTQRKDRRIRELTRLRRQLADSTAQINAETAKQQEQVAVLAKQKDNAERALAAVGGQATGGFVSSTSPAARPAPRNPDGSWPPERCVVDDPTTSGCLTARTLHALQQAKAAGFKRFVACHRTGDRFEHPKGRACDFAAAQNGFGGTATGNDRLYGNNLAAYFVRNANALGVLYVIWFRQIWMPATGWRAYTSGGGDPSSAHTNHVHLSVI